MLPEIREIKLQEDNFPTKWQAVIFRNYGLVPVRKIAQVLLTDAKTIRREASRLGLKKIKYDENFLNNGYITIIRNNWYLMPYSQIREMLGFSEEKFEFIIKEEDFLWVKLGNYKPDCEGVYYYPLTDEQIVQTDKIAKTVRKNSITDYKYFGFFNDLKVVNNTSSNGIKLIHGFTTPCGDVFLEDTNAFMSDEQLSLYAQNGVNAIYVHGILSKLSYYPFKPELSRGYEKRRKNLKNLTDRAEKFGIKVYLYVNEPRSLPIEDFKKFPHLKGRVEDGYAGFCFEQKEVQDYLYKAVKDLAKSIGNLGGLLTITMSENLTHCNYRPNTNCEVCKNIPPEVSATKVNNVIAKALRDSKTGANVLAYTWGWSDFMNWTDEQVETAMSLLDKDVSVVIPSEYQLSIKKGGIKNQIIDYSISNPGPSKLSIKAFKFAHDNGLRVLAKTQTGNSWECSCVPYIPAYDLIKEHIDNLKSHGVNDYMLSWTLGGYPSPSLDLVNALSNGMSYDDWYKNYYGNNADKVKQAVELYCKGFREYPFSIDGLYFSPKNMGPANLISLEKEEKESAMVCYSFDDYEHWVGPYGYEIYVKQMKKLVKLMTNAVKVIESIEEKDQKIQELLLYTKVSLLHFTYDLYHTEYSYLKRNVNENKEEIISLLKKMRKLTVNAIKYASLDSKISYETSNHYFYVQNNLLEKLVNIDNVLERLA
ncbi:MAG: hypothetical protein J6R83_02105 [Clostridia bacterium]|nr:hypothetical protein [Clostridia bacterium]